MRYLNQQCLRIAVMTSLMFVVVLARAALPSPVGNWITIDDQIHKPKAVVNLYVSQGKLYGKIQKVYKENVIGASDTCTKCTGALKDKPIVGLMIVQGLKANDDGSWSGGTIVDPKTGKVYKCKITPSADGGSLDVRGYIGFSLLGRTQTWKKAN